MPADVSQRESSDIWFDSLVMPVRMLIMEKEMAELVKRLKSRLSSCLYPVRGWTHIIMTGFTGLYALVVAPVTCTQQASLNSSGLPRALKRASPESTTFPVPVSILILTQQPCACQCIVSPWSALYGCALTLTQAIATTALLCSAIAETSASATAGSYKLGSRLVRSPWHAI